MIDNLFLYALSTVLLNQTIVLLSASVITFIIIVVALLTLIKKWGESY